MIDAWIYQLLSLFGVCATVYAGIRADLVEARVMAQNAAEKAESCHARLDSHLEAKH